MTNNTQTGSRKRAAPKRAVNKKLSRSVPEPAAEDLHSQISSLLSKFEKQLKDQDVKVSVADYIRLVQIRREVEDRRPKDIEVTWVDSLKEKKSTDG